MKNPILRIAAFFVLTLVVTLTACKNDNNDDDNNPPLVDKPVALDAKEIFQKNFLARWQKANNVDGYKIDVSTSADFSNHVNGFNGKDVNDVDRCYAFNLQNNVKYYYRIRAYAGENHSEYSNVIEVNTAGEDQLPNGDLETWIPFPKYSIPAPLGVWATANKVVDLLLYMDPPPVTTEPTNDAVTGEWAAKITTILPPEFLLVTGTLASGIFDPDLQNQLESLQEGTPFTSRPIAFRGYYKYLPVNNDSCDIYADLTRWNSATNKRDTIASARLPDNTLIVENYTEFQLPFIYFSAENPDTMIMIYASSAAGDLFIGGVGSTLYIDDISLVY